jgi:hypothetical protein
VLALSALVDYASLVGLDVDALVGDLRRRRFRMLGSTLASSE